MIPPPPPYAPPPAPLPLSSAPLPISSALLPLSARLRLNARLQHLGETYACIHRHWPRYMDTFWSNFNSPQISSDLELPVPPPPPLLDDSMQLKWYPSCRWHQYSYRIMVVYLEKYKYVWVYIYIYILCIYIYIYFVYIYIYTHIVNN